MTVSGASSLGAEQEQPREATLQGQPISHWLAQLGADDYGARERASEALSTADESIIPRLEACRNETTDLEVRVRIQRLLCQVCSLSFEGRFSRLSEWLLDSEDRPYPVPSPDDEGSLEVSAGTVVWTRKYLSLIHI